MAPIYFFNVGNIHAQNYMTVFTIAIAIHPYRYLVASDYYLHTRQPVYTYQKISQQKALTNCSFQQRGIFQKHLCWSLVRFNYVALVFHVDVTQTVAVYLDLIRTTVQPTVVCSRPQCTYSGIFSPKRKWFFNFFQLFQKKKKNC